MASIAFAEQPQRVPKHGLIAGHDRPAELLFDRREPAMVAVVSLP
jgi:hypothetical protein